MLILLKYDLMHILQIKDTTDTAGSASYLDLHPEIDSDGRIRTKLYNKRNDFNFPFISSSMGQMRSTKSPNFLG